MEAIQQFVSFWGGIASITALAITAIGGFVVLMRKGKERQELELTELEQLQKIIADRTKSATTQGKRMDLFIYHQSLYSARRFAQTIKEIQVCTFHLFCAVIYFSMLLLDANADYYIDRATGHSMDFMYDYYGVVCLFYLAGFLYMNTRLRVRVRRDQRRLNAVTQAFTLELKAMIVEESDEPIG